MPKLNCTKEESDKEQHANVHYLHVHVYMYINHYRASFVVGTCGMVIWNIS